MKLLWPKSLLMAIKSTPASSKPVAYECRSVWGVTCLWTPACAVAKESAF